MERSDFLWIIRPWNVNCNRRKAGAHGKLGTSQTTMTKTMIDVSIVTHPNAGSRPKCIDTGSRGLTLIQARRQRYGLPSARLVVRRSTYRRKIGGYAWELTRSRANPISQEPTKSIALYFPSFGEERVKVQPNRTAMSKVRNELALV